MERYYTLVSVLNKLDKLKGEIETLVLDLLNPPAKQPEALAQSPTLTDVDMAHQVFLVPLDKMRTGETQELSSFSTQELQRLTACQLAAHDLGYNAQRDGSENWQELLDNLEI